MNNKNKITTKRGASLSDSPLKFQKVSPHAQRLSQQSTKSVTDMAQRNYQLYNVSANAYQNNMMSRSQRFIFNSLYEFESKFQNSKMKTQQNIDRIVKQQTSYITNTKNMITHQSARLRSASVTIAPYYDQDRLRENTFRGHRSLRNRIGHGIQPVVAKS